jgi:hypothetical protein
MMDTFRRVIRFGVALVAGGVVVGAMAASPPAGASGLAWSTVSTPDTSSSQTNELVGVSCATRSDCWAVGWAGGDGGTAEQTLAEHWNGSAWSIVATPNASSSQNNLLAVDCVTSSDCWAVGERNSSTGGVSETLAEHWNGTAWSMVVTPNTGILFGVACTNSSDCWAVGNSSTGGVPPGETLAEHWNGTAWSVVPTPNNTSWQFNYLYGVACATGSDCWAMGYAANTGTVNQTLAEHWNGTAWSIVATPNTGSSINDLLAVDCVTNSNCWAVGRTGNDEAVNQTLAEHWNGTAWSIVATPLGQSTLSGVTCVDRSHCWAVGAGTSSIEHWHRTVWSIVATPNAAPLSSVACATRSDCWAVGFATNGTVGQTVAEHGTRLLHRGH